MATDINDWSKTTLQAFGLNELSAKRMAGTFMAMGNGMGITAQNGLIMSKTLTQLAGDMASFYNVSISEAETALQAIYTGETETLKRYGIVITEVNLQEYARRQGIQKSITQMTQLEKVMLRYNYVMEVTSQAQGDFARTSGSWANQVRLLKEQFTQLLGILGNGFIKVLTPIVKALNKMLASLISIANAIAKTFGGSGIEQATSNVSSSIGDINAGVGDTSQGLDDANSSAKALAKTIAGFDELNILNSTASGSGGSGDDILGGLGGADGSVNGYGAITETEEYEGATTELSKYLKELKGIIDKWTSKIPKLQINFDKEAALDDLKEIGKNITNIIAGWGTFVISLAIQVANDLDVGKLTNSFLNLIRAATGLASAITDAVIPAFWAFYKESGLQEIVKWIGEYLAEGMDGLADVLDDWAQWFVDNQDQIKIFAEELGKAVRPAADLALIVADIAWELVTTSLGLINTALKGIADNLIRLDSSQIFGLITGLALLTSAINFVKFTMDYLGISFKEVFTDTTIITYLDLLSDKFGRVRYIIDEVIIAFSKFPALLKANGILGTLVIAFNNLSGAIKGVWAILKANPIIRVISIFIGLATAIATTYAESEIFREYVADVFETCKEAFSGIAKAFGEMYEGSLKPIYKSGIKPLIQALGDLFHWLWDTINKVIAWVVAIIGGSFLSVFVTTFGKIAEVVLTTINGVLQVLEGLITFITGIFTGDLDKALNGVAKVFQGLVNVVKNIFKGGLNTVIGFINGVIKGVVSAVNVAIKAINRIKITIPEWVPGIGGKTFGGFNIKLLTATTIPYLANGGVITQPTVAMMGEYAGATNNPEIVAPQNLLQEIISSNNDNIVNALIQQTRQLLTALEDIDFNVQIGDDVIAQSAYRGNQAYKRRTGKPLLV